MTAGAPGNNFGYLSAVSFKPTNLTFSQTSPATIVLEYKDADTKPEAGYLPYGMRIHQYNSALQKFIPVPEIYGTQSVDTVQKKVSVKIDRLDLFHQGTMKAFSDDSVGIFANISIPTVDSKNHIITPATRIRSGVANLVLGVGTAGIYTQHQLLIPNHQISVSGITISFQQATLEEKHGWTTNAVVKITASGEPATTKTLYVEYKDQANPNTLQPSDIIGGTEAQMRIYRWRSNTGVWQKIPGTQSIYPNNNYVSVTLSDALTTAQIYAVGVDITAPSTLPTSVDKNWEILDDPQTDDWSKVSLTDYKNNEVDRD